MSTSSGPPALDAVESSKQAAGPISESSPSATVAPEDQTPVATKKVLNSDRLKLFSMINACLKDGYLCTQTVPLVSFLDETVLHPETRDSVVDFLLIDEDSGEAAGAILLLLGDDQALSDQQVRVAQALSVQGVPCLSFEEIPKLSELKVKLKRLLR